MSDENTDIDHEARLIDAAEREADALLEASAFQAPPPDAVPGFEIIGEIGRGGMGVIYKAVQTSTKRVVALKVMLAGWFASPAIRRRFQREVELGARFQHPGIVRVLESRVTFTGQPFYAMDYVDGIHLDRWISAARPGVRELLRLFIEVCEAVGHAHERDVVHRDLKPANVLIDASGKPHILDFGLSKATEQAGNMDADSLGVSMAGQVIGTLRYLSPEQAGGMLDKVDARTDVYALGVMLYEALTGAMPYDHAGSPNEVMRRIREDSPRRPSLRTHRIGRELETIILKALEKEQQRRYQSATEFGEDLNRYLCGDPIWAQPPSSLYVLRKKISKYRLRIAVVAIAAVLTAVGGDIWRKNRVLERQRELRLSTVRRDVLNVQVGVERGAEAQADLLARIVNLDQRRLGVCETHLVHAQLLFRITLQQQRQKKVEVVMDDLRRELERDPSQWAFRALLGEMHRATGDHQQARPLVSQAKREAPDTAEAWYLWSLTTLDPRTAAEYAARAVSIDPEHLLAWVRLAHLRLRNEEYDDALVAARKAVELGDDPYTWAMFQGDVLIKLGKYAEAAKQYSQAIDFVPDKYVPHKARAVALLCQKEYAGAVEDYATAVDIEGLDTIWIRYARATPLWILGRTAEAAEDYRWVRAHHHQISYADARLFIVLCEQERKLRAADRAAEAEAVRKEADGVLDAARRKATGGTRLWDTLECLAGSITPAELATAADPADLVAVCEANYYAGEVSLLQGRSDEARAFFQSSIATGLVVQPHNVWGDPMNEYHLARWRVEQLNGSAKPVAHSNDP